MPLEPMNTDQSKTLNIGSPEYEISPNFLNTIRAARERIEDTQDVRVKPIRAKGHRSRSGRLSETAEARLNSARSFPPPCRTPAVDEGSRLDSLGVTIWLFAALLVLMGLLANYFIWLKLGVRPAS